VNVEEIFRGLFPREVAAADRLISGLRIAPLGAAQGRQAGEWRRTYADQGRTLAQADCLVAAAALTVGARLATGNPKDFPMPELTVEHWPVGS
jgi:predicted nucleic acid-binding protein